MKAFINHSSLLLQFNNLNLLKLRTYIYGDLIRHLMAPYFMELKCNYPKFFYCFEGGFIKFIIFVK